MIRRSARYHRRKEDPDLNITAFMNLMVVLVPFLLITAVFSRLTILELNLPAPSSEARMDEKEIFNLEVVVAPERIVVAHRATGPMRIFDRPPTAADYDYRALSDFLLSVKERYPDKTDVTVLVGADTPYDTLVQVMDAVRAHSRVDGGRLVQTDLFPDISIGDAPT